MKKFAFLISVSAGFVALVSFAMTNQVASFMGFNQPKSPSMLVK